MDREIELLAPAGSRDALTAAIQNGADAVYMGGTKFSARRMADNFETEALREAVEYAHLYGVRIYITLNILIKEKELSEIRDYLDQLSDLCIDGVIVQDLGVAKIIAEEYPQLSLHASTQMTIHEAQGAKTLETLGFKRVVLARELTLDEIREISDKTNLELEGFIHGALCVSYSGQCLMSSMIGGRSGNRGMCAQPCRMPYRLGSGERDKDKASYHLSPKDLSTIDILGQIIDNGITSLKIEGRMKRPEYVAVVVREYRKAIDRLIETGKGDVGDQSRNELLQIFNRGFTHGHFLETNHGSLYANDKPNNRGVPLGKVLRNEGKMVYISLEEELEVGDGIEFRQRGRSNGKGQTVRGLTLAGGAVTSASKGQQVAIRTTFNVNLGTQVYRTSKARQLKEAADSYKDIYGYRKIPLRARVGLKKGHVPLVELSDQLGNSSRASGKQALEGAINRPISRQDIILQLERLGDTPFIIDSWGLDIEDGIFIPLSILNKLRRQAGQDLIEARVKHFNQKAHKNQTHIGTVYVKDHGSQLAPPLNKSSFEPPDSPKLKAYIDRLDLDPFVLNGLDMVYYNPSGFQFSLNELLGQVATIKKHDIKVSLALPTITRKLDMELLRSLPDEFWQAFDQVEAGNIGQLDLLQEKGIDQYHGSYSFNIMNSMATGLLESLNMSSIVLSPELTLGEMHDINKNTYLPCQITVFGRIRLMTTEYCPHHTDQRGCNSCNRKDGESLTDRMGYSFPLVKKRISRCYTEILNSLPIFVADDISGIRDLKAAAWGLRLERLPQEDIQAIVSLYTYVKDKGLDRAPASIMESIDKIKTSGFTRGHFFRGVD
ncbi:MAG TPA: DUF3656 domain-containing protein [Bacillota bacterium]|nr:DUF3656 domain-containing protein [Bacillota bacterium]